MAPIDGTKVPEEKVRQREAYSSPKLVTYGTIAKLTQGGGATAVDGGGMLMMCL